MTNKNIALFPIPNVVGLPGHTLHLHVFEPRYRSLVKHCLETGDWIGLPFGTLTKSRVVIPSAEEYLNSNQESYQSAEIFGAGTLSLLEELPDGRYRVKVELKERFKLIHKAQLLPFVVAVGQVEPELTVPNETNFALRKQLSVICNQLIQQNPGLGRHWTKTDFFLSDGRRFSEDLFEVLKWILLTPETVQSILVCSEPVQRLRLFSDATTPILEGKSPSQSNVLPFVKKGKGARSSTL